MSLGEVNIAHEDLDSFLAVAQDLCIKGRVSVQGVKSLDGHFACLCREFDFYEVKKNVIIFIVKSHQKEQNITNLLL